MSEVNKVISRYMSELGKKGGSSKSEKKRTAAKANILKRWQKEKGETK